MTVFNLEIVHPWSEQKTYPINPFGDEPLGDVSPFVRDRLLPLPTFRVPNNSRPPPHAGVALVDLLLSLAQLEGGEHVLGLEQGGALLVDEQVGHLAHQHVPSRLDGVDYLDAVVVHEDLQIYV